MAKYVVDGLSNVSLKSLVNNVNQNSTSSNEALWADITGKLATSASNTVPQSMSEFNQIVSEPQTFVNLVDSGVAGTHWTYYTSVSRNIAISEDGTTVVDMSYDSQSLKFWRPLSSTSVNTTFTSAPGIGNSWYGDTSGSSKTSTGVALNSDGTVCVTRLRDGDQQGLVLYSWNGSTFSYRDYIQPTSAINITGADKGVAVSPNGNLMCLGHTSAYNFSSPTPTDYNENEGFHTFRRSGNYLILSSSRPTFSIGGVTSQYEYVLAMPENNRVLVYGQAGNGGSDYIAYLSITDLGVVSSTPVWTIGPFTLSTTSDCTSITASSSYFAIGDAGNVKIYSTTTGSLIQNISYTSFNAASGDGSSVASEFYGIYASGDNAFVVITYDKNTTSSTLGLPNYSDTFFYNYLVRDSGSSTFSIRRRVAYTGDPDLVESTYDDRLPHIGCATDGAMVTVDATNPWSLNYSPL